MARLGLETHLSDENTNPLIINDNERRSRITDEYNYLYRRRHTALDDDLTTDDDIEDEFIQNADRERLRLLLEAEQTRLLNQQLASQYYILINRLRPRQNVQPAPDYDIAYPQRQQPNCTSYTNSYPTSARDSPKPVVSESSLKELIGPAQHFAHMVCKALSLPSSIYGICNCLSEAAKVVNASDGSARAVELVLAALWGGVSAYLSYAFIDGLMLRWLVMYSSTGTILRLLSINTLMAALVRILISTFAQDSANLLSSWILIACLLTAAYTIQNFVTSNIAIEERARRVDIYHIAVFAVVPVGVASFITMLGLIRSLVIVRSNIADG
ncbi:N-glycosylation protein-domain-containing protein [Lipomyces arxii]|uniref:N-glycosylation protein-domain-containing protein n=1 Tax=Lipomyces arxii TaxID=56418 RepID=UPI0034CE2FF6